MESGDNKKAIIEGIRQEIEASKGTYIWKDYVNALNLISQVVFTRSTGFILEFIQNAEDSGIDLGYAGVFEISMNKRRVKIMHNGRPFTENDVKAICGIRSSKKPEKGTLGYLGIGFKSVFKITDSSEIYSNGFQFKFDKNASNDPNNTPWHVTPIWISKPYEEIDGSITTFIIPYREEEQYDTLFKEVKNLKIELYLFLRWLKKIKVIDEVSDQTWTLESLGEKDGITTLKHDNKLQRFKFFRREVEVPQWVKQDNLTQAFRANVKKRSVSIAFALDEEENLAPLEAGAMYGGVYSFLPLGETTSGAKFPIQVDFLVQPGRDAVNYEAKWNHWLLEEVADLCKEAIEYFKSHAKWKYQFLSSFEFRKDPPLESYRNLFGPKLIQPIEEYFEETESVPTVDGGWAKPKQVVMVTEDETAVDELIASSLIKAEEIAPVMGGQQDLKLAHRNLVDRRSEPIKQVNRISLLENHNFLEFKSKQPTAAVWFRKFYLWLEKYPLREKDGRKYQLRRYYDFKIVLTSKNELMQGGNVLLPDMQASDQILKDHAYSLQESKSILHPSILGDAKDEEERKTLRGFLMGFTGVQQLDSKTVCKETMLPKILITAPKPSPDNLLRYSTYCQQILGKEINSETDFWVLTKENQVKAAKEVFLSKEFKPLQDWETNKEFLPGISFVSPNYLEGTSDDEQSENWRNFFKVGGIKDSPDNGVELFAMNYCKKKLGTAYHNIIAIDKMNFGYDLKAESNEGNIEMHIEVKGQTHEQDVELTGGEVKAADAHKESFYLCVISGIPENPSMHMVKNPANLGKKDKLTIPIEVWKPERWENDGQASKEQHTIPSSSRPHPS